MPHPGGLGFDPRGRLLALSRGFMASRIFLTAIELGVFHHLAARGLSAPEVAQRTKADARAVEVLLNALVAIGLLEKTDEQFVLARGVDELVRGSPDGAAGYAHAVRQWEAWSRLTEVVRTGRPAEMAWSADAERAAALAMNEYARESSDALMRAVDLSSARRILDLGGGAGACALAILRRQPQTVAVIFDKSDAALRAAEEAIAREDLTQRAVVRQGDFLRDDLGVGYDVALLGSIVCLFGEEENLRLLTRVRASLAAGGRVVIRDAFVDASGTAPAAAAIFSVHLLVSSPHGRSHPYPAVEGWLRRLDFGDIRRVPAGGIQVIIGRRTDSALRPNPEQGT